MPKSGKREPNHGPVRPGRARFVLACVVFLAVGSSALLVFLAFEPARRPGSLAGTPAPLLEGEQKVFAEYGGSPSCKECHEEQFRAWQNSNHGLAERVVEPGRDRSAFDPSRSFSHGTQSSQVRWTNDTAQVISRGLTGNPEVQDVGRVIGNDPLRQFLVPFSGGRFQALEAAYDPRSNQWFNVYGQEDRQPGEWGHWTGRGMNWNFMCASCHNTRLRRNYDEATDSYHTTMAERSVGCEACHGPLRAHNVWQKQFGKSGQKDPTLSKPTHGQVLDYCGFCHARRTDLTGDFKPGDAFLDHFNLAVVDHTDRYYADGQVRDEDYEYASFLGSRMHGRGVYCLDCHEPHSLKTRLPGNWLCLRCHNGTDTNAPVINPSTHSRHQVFGFDTNGQPVNLDLAAYRPREIKQTGGECVNCHMPQTPYMQRHWRHDHGFTSPDPSLTKQFGIPNACNRCHQDKDADWSLRYCNDWYGPKMERPARQRAQVIAHAQRGEPGARQELLDWLGKEETPYWQAVTLGLLQPWAARQEVTAVLLRGLESTNALVRTLATGALEPALMAGRAGVADSVRQRLEDPVRSVRVAAASLLRATLDPNSRAGREFALYLDSNADEPSGQMAKGACYFARNELSTALVHYQKAVAWDPFSAPTRQELAVVLSALNRPQEAFAALKEACRLAPRDADAHFHLALACNELGDVKGAADELNVAVQLEPRHARAWYNLGLAQDSLHRSEDAIESLVRGESVDPEDPRIPYARATILARLGRTSDAKAAARRALELDPASAPARELLEQLSN
jgi:Flp pilus assembly protein TadD